AALLICYDMDFAWNPRNLAVAGAEFFCMPTLDDGAWGGTQHAQHALLPRLRAIENRRPVVQASTSGVSQIINDRGQVLNSIPFRLNLRPDRNSHYLEGYAAGEISPNSALSVYTRWGHWLGPAAAVSAAIMVIAASMRMSSTRTAPAKQNHIQSV